MWVRFKRDDWRTVAHFLGVLVWAIGAIMVVPLATAVLLGEWGPAVHYLFSVGLAFTIGGVLRLADIRPRQITRRQAIIVVALAWLTVGLIGAVPLYLSGHWGSYLDALFEAVSGFTTSGLTLVQDLDHLAYSHNMWRHLTHLIGGQGVIVIAIAFAFVGRLGGTVSLYQAEGRDEHILPNLMHTARFIWAVTGVIVVVGTIALTLVNLSIGLEPIRAALHGFWITVATYDTGGFAPMSQNTMYYHSGVFETVSMYTMLAGMLNFALHANLWRGDWREMFKNIETRTLAIGMTILTVVISLSLAGSELFGDSFTVFRKGAYHIVSANSGTGHQTIYAAQWLNVVPSGALIAVILAMGFGGAVGSTAGGIKAMRVGVIAKSIVGSVKSALAPESAIIKMRYHHIVDRILSPELASGAASIFVLYLLTYTAGAIVGASYGYDLRAALFESVSATANVGLSAGITSPAMPVGLKITYMLQMWAGRLEFISLFALIAGLFVSARPKRRVKR